MEARLNGSGHVAGLIDLGTNSARLLVVRINENKSYTILNQQRIMVRLGEGSSSNAVSKGGHGTDHSRPLPVRLRGAELGAEEIYAVATSATRDAENRDAFLERVRREAEVDLKIISGLEEARLIYLRSRGHASPGGHRSLRGHRRGSTELIVGNQAEHFLLDSLKLGAVRLSSSSSSRRRRAPSLGPVRPPPAVRAEHLPRSVQRIQKFNLDLAVGSSGTMETLGR